MGCFCFSGLVLAWPCQLAVGSGLAGFDAADLVPGHPEAPVGGHLPPRVVAIASEQAESVFFLTFDGQVAVCGEDLPVDPVAQ